MVICIAFEDMEGIHCHEAVKASKQQSSFVIYFYDIKEGNMLTRAEIYHNYVCIVFNV